MSNKGNIFPRVKIIANDVSSDVVEIYISDVIAKFHDKGIVVRAKYCITHEGEINSVTLDFVG